MVTELRRSRARFYFWSTLKKYYLQGKGSLTSIYRQAHSVNIRYPLRFSEEMVISNATSAKKEYNMIKKSAPWLRTSFLRSDGQRDSKISGISRIRTEKLRRIWRKVTNKCGKLRMKTITEVEVSINSQITRFRTQSEVEQALANCISKRFKRAYDSPFLKAPVIFQVGMFAEKEEAKKILLGQSSLSMDLYSNFYIRSFSDINSRLITEYKRHHFQSYWNHATEKTSSSISGKHFGHYKAAAKDDTLSNLHAKIIETSYNTGLPLSRWKFALACLLEKIANVILVDKLRAILLLEADFNGANKTFFGKRMIDRLEGSNQLPDELFPRRETEAIKVALNRILLSDIARQKKRTLAIAGADVAYCYDCVVHPFASLACQKVGMPQKVTTSFFSIIQDMKIFLRTGYGDSTTSFSDASSKFQGLLQGNGAAPAIWLLISMFLILLMKSFVRTPHIQATFSGIIISLIALVFVDDTDLFTFSFPNEPLSETINRLKAMILHWKGALYPSGRKLRPEKCYWYVIHFLWINGLWKYGKKVNMTIQLPNDDGEEVNIEQLDVSVAKEVVGVWVSPDGKCNRQMEKLLQKTITFSEKLKTSFIDRNLLWMGVRNILWLTIRYSLPATSFSVKQCEEIIRPIKHFVLPKLGLSKKFPHAILYSPLKYGGRNFPNIYWEQGILHIDTLLSHASALTITGKLILSEIENLQLEVGELVPVLSLDFYKYSYRTTPCWAHSLWEFISKHKLTVSSSSFVYPTPLREHDVSIMSALQQLPSLTKSDLDILNRVRQHLQVTSLADITTGDGKKIRFPILNGTRQLDRISSLE